MLRFFCFLYCVLFPISRVFDLSIFDVLSCRLFFFLLCVYVVWFLVFLIGVYFNFFYVSVCGFIGISSFRFFDFRIVRFVLIFRFCIFPFFRNFDLCWFVDMLISRFSELCISVWFWCSDLSMCRYLGFSRFSILDVCWFPFVIFSNFRLSELSCCRAFEFYIFWYFVVLLVYIFRCLDLSTFRVLHFSIFRV